MKLIVLSAAAAGVLLASSAAPTTAGPTTAAPVAAAPVHCQIPCGIYGDKLRIDLMLEDAETIAKGMSQILQLEDLGDAGNRNQIVRWVMNKDTHAQAIQDQVAAYWLAQRIKAPAGGDDKAKNTYHRQLELLHGITVTAMKCKQTTDAAQVENLRKHVLAFSETYFSKEDVKHIREHVQGDH